MKQYANYGLKYPVVTGETGGDDALLHAFGDEAVGMISCCPYTLDLQTDGNQRFVKAIMKDFNVVPGFYAAGLYVNCDVVEAGLKGAGGKTDDKEKFMAALKAVKLTDTPRGPISFDHLGNVIGNFYIRRIEKQSDAPYGLKLWNKTLKTYENVSQFWTWPEKEFLAHPVYSRDYPPLKSADRPPIPRAPFAGVRGRCLRRQIGKAAMTFWLLLTVNSITFGGLLFLLSAGFSLIFGLMRIPNLTHGSFFMLGAYFGATFAGGMLGTMFNFWLAALMAAALVALFGAVIERFLLRQPRRPAAGAGAGDARHFLHRRRPLPDGLDRRSRSQCRRRPS